MNWYKIGQENNGTKDEVPEWDYPGADHDYNPSWDYEIDTKADAVIVNYVNQYIDTLKKELFPQLDVMEDIKPAFIKNEKKALGKYISGTMQYAIILINVDLIKKMAKKYKDSIYRVIDMTILHELAHAIQDSLNMYMNEEQAESFAVAYYYSKTIERFWEEKKGK